MLLCRTDVVEYETEQGLWEWKLRGDEAGNKLEEESPALTDQTDSRGGKQCKVVLGCLAFVKDDVIS